MILSTTQCEAVPKAWCYMTPFLGLREQNRTLCQIAGAGVGGVITSFKYAMEDVINKEGIPILLKPDV